MLNNSGDCSVVACVVTYNPTDELSDNLLALASQFQSIIIVDNGSENQSTVVRLANKYSCQIICNHRNLGVAAALNQAVTLARSTNCEWLATFDQDSKIPSNSKIKLCQFYVRYLLRERVGIISMAHVDRALKKGYIGKAFVISEGEGWRMLRATITSGSFVRMTVFSTVGLFDEKLFIDAVDHDFCLRLRRKNWRIVEVGGVVLEHSIGHATSHRLMGYQFACTHHSPLRRYYMTRNHLEVSRRNMFFDPKWVAITVSQLIAGNFVTLIYEDQKFLKLRAIFLGILDFLFRRFGSR